MTLLQAAVHGLGTDPDKKPVVVLRITELEALMPIWIGAAEAVSIQMEIDAQTPRRPVTHDLMNAFDTLGVRLLRITISRVHEGTFTATLHLKESSGREVEVDACSCDAIALALRAKAPISISEEVTNSVEVFPEAQLGAQSTNVASGVAFSPLNQKLSAKARQVLSKREARARDAR